MLKATSFNDIAIVTVKEIDYNIHTMYIIRDKVINILRNVDLTEKKNHIKHKNLLSHIKMVKEIIMCDDIELGTHKFHRYKSPIF